MTQTLERPTDTPAARVAAWLDAFQAALDARDADAAAELFAPTCFWRDLVAFTWNITTAEGRDAVAGPADRGHRPGRPDRLPGDRGPGAHRGGRRRRGLDPLRDVGRPRPRAPAAPDGKAWTLLTTLYELTGHEEPVRPPAAAGAEHGANKDRQTWLERREAEATELGLHPPAATCW